MTDFIKFASEQPLTVALTVWLLMKAVRELADHIQWWKEKAKGYHEKESQKEDFEQKVCDIACTSEEHTKALTQIGEALEGINKRLDEAENERKQDTVANSRATLYHLYETLKDKPSLTVSEYDTFSAVAERYIAAGGNKTFKNKLIPEILNKHVDEDGV